MPHPGRSLLTRHLAWAAPVLAVGFGWVFVYAMTPPDARPAPPRALPWVRTTNGWERANWLTARQRPFSPPLHPGIIAAFLATSSGLILLIAGSSKKPEPTPALLIAAEDRL